MADGATPPSALVDFIAGTVAGIASLVAGHPFDTVKTRLQAQAQETKGTSARPSAPTTSTTPLLLQNGVADGRRYRSALDALRTIVREESVTGLFKGITSPMLGVAAMNASVFGVYGIALRFLESREPTMREPTSLMHIFLAGCASGVVTA